jgi:hypothetical protein
VTPTPGRFRRFRDTHRASRDGRRDGRRGIPTVHEPSPPPALASLAHRAHEALADLAASVAEREQRRHVQRDAAARARSDAELDVDASARRIAASEAAGPSETLAPDRGPRLGRRVYALAIVAIVIAEFPLNAVAFRLFGEAEVLTWVMTASLAVTLVLCAHGLGSFLRQQNPTMAERRWILVLLALPILTIVAIAVIRARYLEVSSELTGLDTLGPVVSSLAFLVINLLVYTGATMLSYLAHAPIDRLRVERAREQRALTEATRRARSLEGELVRLSSVGEEASKAFAARAERIVAYHRGLMSAYSAANLRARGNPQVPDSLRELPAIELPAIFGEARPSATQDAGTVRELHQAASGAER